MALDISRETDNVLLPMEVSNEIWAKTIEDSAFMQLAQRRSLPGAGQEFQTIDGEPEAGWVNETDEKPVSKPAFGSTSWKGYTMAVIIPFSNQFRRDKNNLYSEIVARAPKALATKFDKTVAGIDDVPGELFDTFSDVASVDIETDPWAGLVAADAAISAADGILDGWALAPAAKSLFLTATDTTGRPLFIDSMTGEGSVPRLMGVPVYTRKGVYNADSTPVTYGFAGDWSSAYFGVVESVSMSVSDQASLTYEGEQINLWQRNMFAIRFEMEVGFKLKWADQFVRLTAAS